MHKLIAAMLLASSLLTAQNTGGGSSGGAGGSTTITSPIPLPVAGTTSGAAVVPFLVDAAGNMGTAGSATAADGRSTAMSLPVPSSQPWGVFPYWFNGTSMDKQFYCNATKASTVTASGATEILAAVASKSYRICAFRVSTTPAVGLTLSQGTGTNCGTATTNLSLSFLGVTNVVLEPGASAAYKGVVANAVCITLGTAQTVNYDISYANF